MDDQEIKKIIDKAWEAFTSEQEVNPDCPWPDKPYLMFEFGVRYGILCDNERL